MHALEIVLGHIVSYFMLHREGLSVIDRMYSFIRGHADKAYHRFSGSLKKELRILLGLVLCAPRAAWRYRRLV